MIPAWREFVGRPLTGGSTNGTRQRMVSFFSHVIRFSSSRFTTIVKSYEDLWFWLVGITLATFASRETAGLWRERRVREFRTDRVQKGEDICGDTKRVNG